MTLITAKQNRGSTRNIIMNDVNGNPIIAAAADEIRAIIKRQGETAKLTIASNAPTANGSTFIKGSPNLLRLDAQDMDFEPGVYSLILDLFDNSDSSEWKNIDIQVFSLEGE